MQSATDKSLLQVLIVEQLQDSLAVKSDESTQTDHEPLQLLGMWHWHIHGHLAADSMVFLSERTGKIQIHLWVWKRDGEEGGENEGRKREGKIAVWWEEIDKR